MSIPEASAIEVVEVEAAPTVSPLEAITNLTTSINARIEYISKDFAKELKADMAALSKLLKKHVKQPRKAKAPKEEGAEKAPPSAWNNFVAETLTKMKEEGWPAYEVKDKTYAGGVQNADGVWIVDDEEEKKRVPPTFRNAMTFAAYRKALGEYAGDPEAEARKAAKAAAAKEAKEAKAKERAEAKAAKKPASKKAAGGAGKKADAESGDEKPVKAAKPAAAVKAAAKPAAAVKPAAAAKPAAATKPAAKPVSKPAAKPAAAAAAAPAAVDDEEALVTMKKWTFKGKRYFRSSENGCWLMKPDGSQGAWAGKYDPVADAIDQDAEEPEYASDDE